MWTTRKRSSVSLLTRTAYHEAGHVVLSASINDTPESVTIRSQGATLGRSKQRMFGRPELLLQVHLAGFAAEHLLTSRRPLDLAREVGFAILTRSMPDVGESFPDLMGTDGQRAVQEVIRMRGALVDDEIAREIDRFYDISRESLSTVWQVVERLAKLLLRRKELDRDDIFAAFDDADLYGPVFAVQRSHGLMPAAAHGAGHESSLATSAHPRHAGCASPSD